MHPKLQVQMQAHAAGGLYSVYCWGTLYILHVQGDATQRLPCMACSDALCFSKAPPLAVLATPC
jgi:hypothetical protein